MKYKTFKDFLISKHAENYHGTDDNMPAAFDNWLGGELNLDDIMEYADEYAAIQKQEIVGEVEKELIKVLKVSKTADDYHIGIAYVIDTFLTP